MGSCEREMWVVFRAGPLNLLDHGVSSLNVVCWREGYFVRSMPLSLESFPFEFEVFFNITKRTAALS